MVENRRLANVVNKGTPAGVSGASMLLGKVNIHGSFMPQTCLIYG